MTTLYSKPKTLVINSPVNHKRGQIYEAHDGSGRTDGRK